MDSDQANHSSGTDKTAAAEGRLDSWKEIAVYLKREIRTLHRWEAQEGLPIHRHLHKERGSVYAYKSELDSWFKNRRTALEPSAPTAETREQRRYRLGGIAAVVLSLVLVVAASAYWVGRRLWPAHEAKRVMLAVLPFENLSGHPEEDYFSDGLTDELITELGSLEPVHLGVIARTSAMQFKHASKNLSQVGHELNVDYILEGTVRREGNLARVAVELVRVSDQTNVWAEIYERNQGNALGFHEDIAGDVARRIQIKLAPRSQPSLAAARPVNPDAYEAYLKGLYMWNKFTNPDFHKSAEYFQQAIEKDAEYAPAYAGLAAAYVNLVEFGEPPIDFYLKSDAAARKAIELDATSSQAHATLAWSLIYYHHDWKAAQRSLLRALELNPSNSYARMLYAKYLAAMGRFNEAQAQAKRAHQIDPVSLPVNVVEAHVLFYGRQYDAALEQLAKLQEMEKDFPPIYWIRAHVYEAIGRNDEACQNMLKTFDLGSGHVPWFTELEKVRVQSGWRAAWEQWIQGMLDPKSPGYVQPYDLVEPYVDLGRDEEAITWLGRAAEAHDIEIVFIKVDPRFDRLRGNPRFQEIVRSLNFPE